MCGLLGIFSSEPLDAGALVRQGLDAIAHRGPDSRGEYLSTDERCHLGHVRLSILDLSEGAAQPMRRPGGVLVYNGQIYNHRELRQKLPTASLQSHSDTETLAYGLALQGRAFLDRAVGMFAGAFLEADGQTLWVFRDSLGIKPFFWSQTSAGDFCFASEIKALRAMAPAVVPKIHRPSLDSYLTFENFPAQWTFFEGVHSLAPGQVLRVTRGSDGRVVVSSQRSIRFSASDSEDIRLDDESSILNEVRASVDRHLLSDVPVGVYLSGGIDSSLVATLAAERLPGLNAFTGFFPSVGARYDETPVATKLAKKLNLRHVTVPITPEDFMKRFDPLVWTLDEPRMGMGSFSQDVVAAVAGRACKVVLAGHGGDELFCGYPAFKAAALLENRFASSKMWRSLASLRPGEWPWAALAVANRLFRNRLEFAPRIFHGLACDARATGFSANVESSPLQALERYYRQLYLPGLLAVEDRVSMAHSLETRMPLWSQPLVDAAAAVPVSTRLAGGELKGLLRNAARRILPEFVLNAPKRGFPTPLRIWFRTSLREFVAERLLDRNTPLAPIAHRKTVERLLRSHQNTPLPFALDELRAHRIWTLLVVDSWMRQYQMEFA